MATKLKRIRIMNWTPLHEPIPTVAGPVPAKEWAEGVAERLRERKGYEAETKVERGRVTVFCTYPVATSVVDEW